MLIQIGDLEAAAVEEPGWESYRWTSKTVSGEPVAVESRRYAHPAWQRAYQAIGRAKLLQAVGRGRAACQSGFRVVVISKEELGLPITDNASKPMNATETEVLKNLVGLAIVEPGENRTKTLQEPSGYSL